MTTIALCSAKGSPGVSTLACVLGAVWPSQPRVLVAECDPSGGDLAPRFGLSTRHGITSFALARRHGSPGDSIDEHVQRLPGGLEVLVAPVGTDPATALDNELASLSWPIFAESLNVLIDCGRFVSGAPGQRLILAESDHVVVVARPDPSGVSHLRWVIERINPIRNSGRVEVLLAGEGTFSSTQVSRALGAEVLDVIPEDRKAAAIACGAPGRSSSFAKSSLIACARRITQKILQDTAADADDKLMTDDPIECMDCF